MNLVLGADDFLNFSVVYWVMLVEYCELLSLSESLAVIKSCQYAKAGK